MVDPHLSSRLDARLCRPLWAAAFALGLSSGITQLTLLREMLAVFAGNELSMGVVLGNWLLLMGLGASLGRWNSVKAGTVNLFVGLLLLTAWLPPLQVVGLRGLRPGLFLQGEAIGVSGTIAVSLLVLLPYCLAAGFFLALACKAWPAGDSAQGAGRVYALDSLGGVAGGMLFGFGLVRWFDHIALLAVPAWVNGAAAVGLAWRAPAERKWQRRWRMAAIAVAGIGLLGWLLGTSPDAFSSAWQFPGQQVRLRAHSPYGRLIVTEADGQTNIVENGVVLASIPNLALAEEIAHLPLGQWPGAQRVLLIGGALSGAPREILRHGVRQLDCVELDPTIVVLGQQYLPEDFADPRMRVWETDGRRFLRHTTVPYDAILVALPDPSTAQLNRFFTDEFFREARRALRPGGVVCFAMGRYENYAGPELIRLIGCVRQTVSRSFPFLHTFPGNRLYFMASDKPPAPNLADVLERTGIAPRWVTRGYLAAAQAPDRIAALRRAMEPPAPVNRDFAPVLYYLHLRYWGSQFGGGLSWWTIPAGVVLALYACRMPGAPGALFASGFAGASLEMVLLLGLQVIAGAVYREVTWLISLFMLGLAAGAWGAARLARRLQPAGVSAHRHGLCLLAVAVAALSLLLAVLLPDLARLTSLPGGEYAARGMLLLVTLGLAVLVGAQFPLAAALRPDSPNWPGRLYTADFVGAAVGAIATSAWLLPAVGMTGVCSLAGGLNLVAALRLYRERNPA